MREDEDIYQAGEGVMGYREASFQRQLCFHPAPVSVFPGLGEETTAKSFRSS
jgi:hypothetical protein